jgi:predicted PurR-regulated permease PerM
MALREHARTTGTALKNWFVAQLYDSLCVGAIWFVGLLIVLHGDFFWALMLGILAFVFQMVPHFGPVLTLVVMAVAGIFAGKFQRWEPIVYMFILYAIIVVIDGLLLQPLLMRRKTKIPIWATILTPLVLGFGIGPFLGPFAPLAVLLAPPLLAVIYAFREKRREQRVEIIPPGQLPERTRRRIVNSR